MLSQPIQRSLGPICVALVLTILNAIKPVVVDDTAYLYFADQIVDHPLDPYGFELMWSAEPDSAFKTLAPPVFLYWLALCKVLSGSSIFMLKLGLFPFQLLLCVSMRSLTRSLLNRKDDVSWIMIVCSVAVLPMWNCMIDMPTLTLGLAGLTLMLRSRRYRIDPWIAGICLGLAMQTKYTAFTFPMVVLLHGVINRRIGSAIIAVSVSTAVFVSWETIMFATYGQSHFLYHAFHRPQLPNGESSTFDKLWLMRPMATYIGLFTLSSALLLSGISRPWCQRIALLTVTLMLGLCFVPDPIKVAEYSYQHNLAKGFYQSLGVLACLLYGRLLFRFIKHFQMPIDRVSCLLLAWLLIELTGCVGMSPFPAARRFLMIAMVIILLSYHLYGRALPLWYGFMVLTMSLILHTVDCWDALAAKTMAHSAREQIPTHPAGQIWFQGTWGWKYYCEAEGMKQIIPGTTQFRAGDWLVLCVPPDGKGFYRPMALPVDSIIGSTKVQLMAELVHDDRLRVSTIPALYGGDVPIRSRHAPRFRVQVYRVMH